MINHDKAEFLLCTLTHGKLYQQPLDLNFTEGEEVTFYLNGPGLYIYWSNDPANCKAIKKCEDFKRSFPETQQLQVYLFVRTGIVHLTGYLTPEEPLEDEAEFSDDPADSSYMEEEESSEENSEEESDEEDSDEGKK